MKLPVYKIVTPLLICTVFFTIGGSASETSRLRVKFKGKSINLDSDVSAVARKRGDEWRITLGAKNKKIMFSISGTIEGMIQEEGITLDTSWHPLSVMMIHKGIAYSAAPASRLLRHQGARYSKHGKSQGPGWKQMTRNERLSRGRGLVRNRTAEGSRFTLQLIPVMTGSGITALKGSFEGLLVPATNKRKRGRVRAYKIRGSFTVEVEK